MEGEERKEGGGFRRKISNRDKGRSRQRSGRESNGRSEGKLLQKRDDMVRRRRKSAMRRQQQEGWIGREEARRDEGSGEGREEENKILPRLRCSAPPASPGCI